MNILVTGSQGYLGSVLVPRLLAEGHAVSGLDTGFYSEAPLYDDGAPPVPLLRKDIRKVDAGDFRGIDAVVHMAELSNDPAGELAPHITYDINHQGTVHLARCAKAAGVRRFVYMSSCSLYGVAGEAAVDESSPLNPQTAYARCKELSERDLRALADDRFSPTCLRNATAFGASPFMRFDIVLNSLCGWAWTSGEIRMISDGTPWRPLVHALDIAGAIAATIAAPREAIHDEVFNVGSNSQNYRVRDIAETVAAAMPGCKLSFGPPGTDNRSYRVAFDKIARVLPGFRCEWDARRGAEQLIGIFRQIGLSRETFE